MLRESCLYIILLGAPGAGKGTQAMEVSQKLGLLHVASGDLFRGVREGDTDLGRLVKSYYDKGKLVPDVLTIQIVLSRLARPDCGKGCLLDGFPRTLQQAEALDAALRKQHKQVDKVVSIQVSEAELLRRLSGRWLCRKYGAPHHSVYAPPKQAGVCDACGGELYQRPDDTEATAKNRLGVYKRQTAPLIEYYTRQSKLTEVDGEKPVEAVTRVMVATLEGR